MSNHPLSEWLKTRGEMQKEFAARVRTSESHLSQIISGQRRPSPSLAVRMEQETKIDARRLLGIPAEDPAE
jgi:transcriptional regulator with XRE-family HTH domain